MRTKEQIEKSVANIINQVITARIDIIGHNEDKFPKMELVMQGKESAINQIVKLIEEQSK